MEKMFLGRLEEAKRELDEFKSAAREQEKSTLNQVKTANEEKAVAVAERDEQILQANNELNEVRGARDTLIQEKNKLESFQDTQRTEIERLEEDVRRAHEDVECRKLIITEMQASMLNHENESM